MREQSVAGLFPKKRRVKEAKLSEDHKIVMEFRLWQLKESPKQGGGIVVERLSTLVLLIQYQILI